MPIRQASFDFDSGPEEDSRENQSADQEAVIVQEVDNVPDPEKEPVIIHEYVYTLPPPKKSARGRMKLSDMNASASLIEVPEDEVLFQKSYYSIGSVSEMFKVNGSLIRFWENEFEILKPKKNAKGDRLFRPEDVKNLKLIYHLLRERKYTIEGAKEFLKNNKRANEKFQMIESLKKIKSFLHELKSSL